MFLFDCSRIHVQIRGVKIRPPRIEHEADRNRISGTQDVELPSNQILLGVVRRHRPDPIQSHHNGQRRDHREDYDEDILRNGQHCRCCDNIDD